MFIAAGRLAAAAPVRVVSQFVGGDEMLIAVAAPEQIAALSHRAREAEFSAVAAEARAFPELRAGDAESILKHGPTLVLFADYSRIELVEQVRRAGIRLIVFDHYDTLADSYANLRRVAQELGPEAQARAERVIAECERRVRILAQQLRGSAPVRVIAPSTYGVIPGDQTTFQDLCDHANAINLAATLGHLHGHQTPPAEQMLTWPIDRVVVCGATADKALEPYVGLPPYSLLSSVRERRAARIDPWIFSCVTHDRVAGYEALARALHPECFR